MGWRNSRHQALIAGVLKHEIFILVAKHCMLLVRVVKYAKKQERKSVEKGYILSWNYDRNSARLIGYAHKLRIPTTLRDTQGSPFSYTPYLLSICLTLIPELVHVQFCCRFCS